MFLGHHGGLLRVGVVLAVSATMTSGHALTPRPVVGAIDEVRREPLSDDLAFEAADGEVRDRVGVELDRGAAADLRPQPWRERPNQQCDRVWLAAADSAELSDDGIAGRDVGAVSIDRPHHGCECFGVWSIPDRRKRGQLMEPGGSTPGRRSRAASRSR